MTETGAKITNELFKPKFSVRKKLCIFCTLYWALIDNACTTFFVKEQISETLQYSATLCIWDNSLITKKNTLANRTFALVATYSEWGKSGVNCEMNQLTPIYASMFYGGILPRVFDVVSIVNKSLTSECFWSFSRILYMHT